MTPRLPAALATTALLLAGCDIAETPNYTPSVTAEERAFAEKQHPQLLAELGGAIMPPGGLAAYTEILLREVLGQAAQSASIGQPQRRIVNGIETIFVPARVETPQGQAQVTVTVFQGRGREGFHFITAGPGGHERDITALIQSFRFLSPAEAASLKPRKIDVVTVGSGDTIASMARRMAVPDHHLDAFLMLNDRDPKPELRPGEKVKLIVRG